MPGSERATLRPFTPSRERPEALEERTVGRDDILQTIDRRLLKAATSKNRGHTLIVGPRGSGKTHLVEVTLHRLRDDPRFTANAVVGRVDEDVVGIISYADVLLELLASLDPPEDVLQQVRASRDVAAIEAAISAHLDGRLLVAVIENLSRVFDNLGTAGQRDLRSFIENSGQVILLASTPLLFQAIGSREEPWFGSFAIEHLSELTLDEGTELIRRLAIRDGDDRFVRFLADPKGKARLAALHHLAGGSPRLWMILAGCATVELLDDLVPAVEELLERLATYYQQRLWDLPGNEAKLVRELGTGPASATVAELAAGCGLDVRTAATALGRLTDSGWVRSEKVAGTDQRKTWYRLREPLLRHHFQYRRADGEPLRLIVEILRLWFDPLERRFHLAGVRPASEAERHLLATLQLDPPQPLATAGSNLDVDKLLAVARCWIAGDSDGIGTTDAGIILEAAVLAVGTSTAEARRVLDARAAPASLRARADRLLDLVNADSFDTPLEERMGIMLDTAAAASIHESDHRVLELVAACWNGSLDLSRTTSVAQRLEAILDPAGTDRLSLTIRQHYATWLRPVGGDGEALAVFTSLVEDSAQVLGIDHPDTLASRHSLASQLGRVGRHDEAIAAFTALIADMTRAFGGDDRETLEIRQDLAFELGRAGRRHEALRVAADAFDDAAARYGLDHEVTAWSEEPLVISLLRSVGSGEPLPPIELLGSFVSTEAYKQLRDMEAARGGSAEAGARLPAELRSLVEGPAAQR